MAAPPGFSLLAEDASSTDPGADIIAVHGLGGNDCWKARTADPSNKSGSKSEYWLRDWLPIDVPSVRIFTYTYDSSLFLDGSGITEAADTLLKGLQRLRLTADSVKVGLPFYLPFDNGLRHGQLRGSKSSGAPTIVWETRLCIY